MSNNKVLLQILNIVFFIVTLTVNSLAGATTLLNGMTSGQVSDMYPTLVTPAGFTFSIWSVIYVLLFVFIAYQVLPRNREQPFLNRISYLFVLSCVFNVLWLFLWHYDFITFSVPLMLGLLCSLIAIYLRLNIGKSKVNMVEKVCVHLPFSVYLGWITVATIANFSVALTAVGWSGGGLEPATWGILVIVVALLITLIMLATRKDVAYSLVIVWALYGIMSKQADTQNIVSMALASIVVIFVAIVAVAVVFRLRR